MKKREIHEKRGERRREIKEREENIILSFCNTLTIDLQDLAEMDVKKRK